MRAGRAEQRGFALLLVLWVVVLLSAVAIHLGAQGRTELALARNIVDAARAEALADGAIATTMFRLLQPRPEWSPDGLPRRQALDGGEAVIVVEDENAKVNPNLAGEPLLAGLFAALGTRREEARAAARAMVRHRAVQVAALQKAGHDASIAFDSVEDLRNVDGLPRALLEASRPFLTVYGEASVPDPGNAAAVVQRAIREGSASAEGGEADAAGPVDPVFRIVVSVTTASGARFAREAVTRIDPARPAGYGIILWQRARENPAAPVVTD